MLYFPLYCVVLRLPRDDRDREQTFSGSSKLEVLVSYGLRLPVKKW